MVYILTLSNILRVLVNKIERLHQTFVALAASLQLILTQMMKLKQRYLNYRRQCFGDTTDVFIAKKQQSGRDNISIKFPTFFPPFILNI